MKKALLAFLLIGGISISTNTSCENLKSTATKVIKLYVYKNCPYCKKVTSFLKKHNLADKVVTISADNSHAYSELQKLSRSTQCPFLYDEVHNVKMLESADIIAYFKKIFKV